MIGQKHLSVQGNRYELRYADLAAGGVGDEARHSLFQDYVRMLDEVNLTALAAQTGFTLSLAWLRRAQDPDAESRSQIWPKQ
jgi:hypothetical protein